MPNINPIDYISPPLSVDRPTFQLKCLSTLTGNPNVKPIYMIGTNATISVVN